MRNLTFTGDYYSERITLSQVQKRTAKKMYDSGETVYMQSSNFHPFGIWSKAHAIIKTKSNDESFDSLVHNFEYYNCGSESGRYVIFYEKI